MTGFMDKYAPMPPHHPAGLPSADSVDGASEATLARVGRNCWRTTQAARLAVLVDGEDYYRALHHALRAARRSILFVGWEFDSRIRLLRGQGTGEDDEIGRLLSHAVRARPELHIHVLIWDSALIYAFNREIAGAAKMRFLSHRRIHYRLDDAHPLGASHHQKVVVIDDSLAFVGGLDVASQRWDTRDHKPADPRRRDDTAEDYMAFHDVMAMAGGAAARALGDLCRERWKAATGEHLEACRPSDVAEVWPPWVPPLMTDIPVSIARTRPSWDELGSVREIEVLYIDMIAAARGSIYIENQYFASRHIASALADRLRGSDCPEIVIINPGDPASLVERSTMGVARARLYRELKKLDRNGRLRIYHPVVDGTEVKVHAKLMIVDDCMARIGSANLNNRSMGLDTECDLFFEAAGDPEIAGRIAALRRDLMAEHLGATPNEVAEAEGREGGLIGAIDALSGQASFGRKRRLMPLDASDPRNVVQLIADSEIPDPKEPVEGLVWIEESMPGPAKRPLQLRVWALAAVLAGLAALGVAWRWAPLELATALDPVLTWAEGLDERPETVLVVVALFLAGGLARVPVSLLVLLTAGLFGIFAGTVLALTGAMASALLLFGLGRILGRVRTRRIGGWRVNRVQRALSSHGIMAIMLLRLMPVAAFSVINMVAGAIGVRLRDFVIGTVIGMAPGVFAMSVVGDRLVEVLLNPSPGNLTILAGATAVVIFAVFGLVNRLARVRAGR